VWLGLLGILACVAPAATQAATAAPTTVATLHGPTAVRTWNGVQAWTDYNAADKRRHVVVRSAGQISTPAAIPAGGERLKVDVGPGPDGKPAIAFVSCAVACRVVVSALDGSRAQTVAGSEGASSPTIWGSRVAWVRGRTVRARRLAGGKVTRLAGVPRRICYVSDRRRCERPGGASVRDLELYGSRLALIDRYGLPHGGGNGQFDVRMESVRGGRQRLVALLNVGESGQAWVGPSWAKGNLFFYKSCVGGCDPGAGGPYRYDVGSHAYARAPEPQVLTGFAMDDDGRHAFEAVGGYGYETCDEPGAAPCLLQLTGPFTFKRTRRPIPREFG
jgi:hypothetical protein